MCLNADRWPTQNTEVRANKHADALERAEAVATAQVAGRGKASAADQEQARELIKDMLSRGGEIQVQALCFMLWHWDIA